MMLYLRFAWRELRQRPSRPILTLLSIVIGVAAVVAVTIASGTTSRAFDEIFKTVAGKAALEVSTPIGKSYDEKVLEKVKAVPGVEAVAPLMSRDTQVQIGEYGQHPKKFRMSALGIDPAIDGRVRDYTITEGKSIAEEPGVLFQTDFAKNQGIEVGQSIKFLSREGSTTTKVVGLYSSKGLSTNGAGSPMYLPLNAAQELWHNRGRVDSAQVLTSPGVDEKAIESAIAKVLPSGLEVKPPVTRSAMAEELSLSTAQGMRMARGFSLIVAALIIMNTFLINVAQRRRQIGIMRAIGATRGQVASMLFREAFIMGVVGTILGSLIGILAAHYLSGAMSTLYQATLPPIELTAYPFIVGAACGLGVSFLAVIWPVWKATRLSPLEAMRDVLPEEIEGVQWWLVALGAVLATVAVAVMGASIMGWISMIHTVWAANVLLFGLVFMLPLALKPLTTLTALIMKPFLAVESRLARLQLLRHRSRTTLTVGVVFMAAATGFGLANSVIDNVNDVQRWYQKTIVADFFLRAAEPSMATGLAPDLPEGIGEKLKEMDGIASIEGTRFGRIKMGNEVVTLIARDHTAEAAPELDIVKGDVNALREQFKNGAVALGSVLAQRSKLTVGDKVSLQTDTGEKTFPVAAVINDYQSGGLTVHMERSVARNDLGYDGVSAYIIKAEPEKLAEVKSKLVAMTDENSLMLETFADVRKRIDGMMSGVVACLWAMVVLGLLVSAIGVTNTLTINVLEQTRELGLMRIVAMTRAQVRKTIFAQAMILAILALLPGIIAGVSVAYLINVAMMPIIGHPVEFNLHPSLLLAGLAVGLAVVAFAAWFPADRAARLDLLEAVRTL